MLVNYTSDKKLLDLLATSDYLFGSSHVGESTWKYLNLKGLFRKGLWSYSKNQSGASLRAATFYVFVWNRFEGLKAVTSDVIWEFWSQFGESWEELDVPSMTLHALTITACSKKKFWKDRLKQKGGLKTVCSRVLKN